MLARAVRHIHSSPTHCPGCGMHCGCWMLAAVAHSFRGYIRLTMYSPIASMYTAATTESMVGSLLCSYDYAHGRVCICAIGACSPSHGLLAFANCSRVLGQQSQQSKGSEARLLQVCGIGLHTALPPTQSSPAFKIASASYSLPYPTPSPALTHMHRAMHIIMHASLQCCGPAISILDRLRATWCVLLHMLVCCWHSPVEHVPVWLDEDAHEEGVVGASCQVGAAGGWVPGIEVI